MFLHSRIPQPNSLHSFGAKLIFELFGLKSPISQLLSLASIFIIFIFVGMFSLHRHAILPKIEKIEEYYFVLGAAILIFCFFSNSNHDYRLIFCLFLLPAFYSWLGNSQISFYLRLIFISSIILMLVIMWMPYVYFFFNRVAFDLSFLSTEIHRFRIILTWLLFAIITVLASLLLRPLSVRHLQK